MTGISSRKIAQVQRASDGKRAVWREAETVRLGRLRHSETGASLESRSRSNPSSWADEEVPGMVSVGVVM